jgi:ankyrin repeat protein
LKLRFHDQFSFYAVFEWPIHAKKVEHEQVICPFAFTFFRSDSFRSWRELWELAILQGHRWWEDNEAKDQDEILWPKALCEIQSTARWGHGSALYYAALFGFRDVTALLLTYGHDPNELGGVEAYPLFAALRNGHTNVAILLLRSRANINAKHHQNEETALHRAIKNRKQKVVEFLVTEGADLAIHNGHGMPPLHLAVKKLVEQVDADGSEYVKMLAVSPYIDVKDKRGRTALHLAANLSCVSSAATLLKCNANINALDDEGRIPLHLASIRGDLQMIGLLLKNKCHATAADRLGYTALHLAVRSGNPELVARLSLAEDVKNSLKNLSQLEGEVCSHCRILLTGRMHVLELQK